MSGARITKFLKPYRLRLYFSNKYLTAQVIHTPTMHVSVAASTQEKGLRMQFLAEAKSTHDVAAATRVGAILAERLKLKDIPAVSVALKKDQVYHGKVKALVDSLRDSGIQLI